MLESTWIECDVRKPIEILPFTLTPEDVRIVPNAMDESNFILRKEHQEKIDEIKKRYGNKK